MEQEEQLLQEGQQLENTVWSVGINLSKDRHESDDLRWRLSNPLKAPRLYPVYGLRCRFSDPQDELHSGVRHEDGCRFHFFTALFDERPHNAYTLGVVMRRVFLQPATTTEEEHTAKVSSVTWQPAVSS